MKGDNEVILEQAHQGNLSAYLLEADGTQGERAFRAEIRRDGALVWESDASEAWDFVRLAQQCMAGLEQLATEQYYRADRARGLYWRSVGGRTRPPLMPCLMDLMDERRTHTDRLGKTTHFRYRLHGRLRSEERGGALYLGRVSEFCGQGERDNAMLAEIAESLDASLPHRTDPSYDFLLFVASRVDSCNEEERFVLFGRMGQGRGIAAEDFEKTFAWQEIKELTASER